MDAYDFHAIAVEPALPAPNLAHIAAPDLTPQQRTTITSWLQQIYLPSPATQRVEKVVGTIIDRNANARPGAKMIPIVTAANGVGKSTTMLAYMGRRYRERFEGRTLHPRNLPTFSPELGVHAIHCPVVWLNVRPQSGIGGLDESILQYFRAARPTNASERTSRTLQVLRDHGVEVVVVDDAHLFQTLKVRGRELLDYLKVLNTELGMAGATLVIIGADLEGTALAGDPQIRCRSVTSVLPEFDLTGDGGRAECQTMLTALEGLLRENIPGIAEGAVTSVYAGHLTRRVGGRPGDLIKLVVTACSDFIEDTTATRLTKDHIRDAMITDRADDFQRHEARIRSRRRRADTKAALA